jgi:hypothetical protein
MSVPLNGLDRDRRVARSMRPLRVGPIPLGRRRRRSGAPPCRARSTVPSLVVFTDWIAGLWEGAAPGALWAPVFLLLPGREREGRRARLLAASVGVLGFGAGTGHFVGHVRAATHAPKAETNGCRPPLPCDASRRLSMTSWCRARVSSRRRDADVPIAPDVTSRDNHSCLVGNGHGPPRLLRVIGRIGSQRPHGEPVNGIACWTGISLPTQ